MTGRAMTGPIRQSLAWSHGVVTAEALGGMIGPTSFVLPDGRQVAPFHIAPWFDEALPPGLPGILHRLRGEWPCVPFGADGSRDLPPGWLAEGPSFDGAGVPHGHSSNVAWQLGAPEPEALTMTCAYPDDHPILALHREIRPDPVAPALDLTLTVTARRPCRLPFGLHPTLRLPTNGRAVLCPPAFAQGRVFPLAVEKTSRLAPDASFARLDAVPLADGGTLNLTDLPLDSRNEELVQLCGVTGDVVLRYREEGFQLRLGWNTAHLPSVLLWVSNRGRDHAPWNSRHLALGIEPVSSAFDLGPAISNGTNPIAGLGVPTSMAFTPDQPFTTRYRIAVEPLAGA